MGAYSSRVIADGATYYWRLGEPSGTSAVEAIGGVNGTIAGGVTLGVTGAVNDGTSAMAFDGASGIITTAATVTTPLTCTIEWWLKIASGVTTAFAPCWTNDTSGTGDMLYVGTQQTGGGVVCVFKTGGATFVGLLGVRDGAWHHIVVVLTGTQGAIYVDGVVDRALTPFVRTTPGVGVAVIGRDLPASGAFFTGSLDDIAIYPTALSAPTIATHYSLGITAEATAARDTQSLVGTYLKNTVYAGTASADLTTNWRRRLNAIGGDATKASKALIAAAGASN